MKTRKHAQDEGSKEKKEEEEEQMVKRELLALEGDDTKDLHGSSSDSMPELQNVSDTDSDDTPDSPDASTHARYRPDSPFPIFHDSVDLDFANQFDPARVRQQLPYFQPPAFELHGRHDDSRWTIQPGLPYRPLTTSRYPYQVRLHGNIARRLTTFLRITVQLSRINFGSRRSQRRTPRIEDLITREQFDIDFGEPWTFESLNSHLSHSKDNSYPNRWIRHIPQLRLARRMLNSILEFADRFIKTYGYPDGLQSYAEFHNINTNQPFQRPHPFLCAFEIQYLITLRRFFYDYNCPNECFQVSEVLIRNFREAHDLYTLTHLVLIRLDPPHFNLGVENPHITIGPGTIEVPI